MVSLRSTTGYTLGCLRHPWKARAAPPLDRDASRRKHPRPPHPSPSRMDSINLEASEVSNTFSIPKGMPATPSPSLHPRGTPRPAPSSLHPGGISAGSRRLSAATPPDTRTTTSTASRRDARGVELRTALQIQRPPLRQLLGRLEPDHWAMAQTFRKSSAVISWRGGRSGAKSFGRMKSHPTTRCRVSLSGSTTIWRS